MIDSKHSLFSEIIGGLVRSMLHDFNGPLSSIIGYSSKNISRTPSVEEDWRIIYDQGLILCENFRYWQNITRKQVPQYNGNVVELARYVFRGFKSSYASKLTLEWDEDVQDQNSVLIALEQEEHFYFWVFLFAYFMRVLPDDAKGQLIISICDKDNIAISAELHTENLIETNFTRKLKGMLLDIVIEIAVEREMSSSKLKIVLKKDDLIP
ncbi:MAG: hypothetical protein K8S87_07155 [Planctomycetes bacterium]|nr:hypothetical protein [Planctomycetota bacterium]